MSEEEVILTNCLINFKIELKNHQQVYDKWINNNSSTLASLWMDRKFIISVINERDDNNKLKKTLKERKELSLDKQNLSDQIIILANKKKKLHCLVITAQQLIKNQKIR